MESTVSGCAVGRRVSLKRDHQHEADLEATRVDLGSARTVAKRAQEMLDDERKHAMTSGLDVERRTLEANVELEHVRSELKHAQMELKAEHDKSTEAASKVNTFVLKLFSGCL